MIYNPCDSFNLIDGDGPDLRRRVPVLQGAARARPVPEHRDHAPELRRPPDLATRKQSGQFYETCKWTPLFTTIHPRIFRQTFNVKIKPPFTNFSPRPSPKKDQVDSKQLTNNSFDVLLSVFLFTGGDGWSDRKNKI